LVSRTRRPTTAETGRRARISSRMEGGKRMINLDGGLEREGQGGLTREMRLYIRILSMFSAKVDTRGMRREFCDRRSDDG
jgi:hypothetical protein